MRGFVTSNNNIVLLFQGFELQQHNRIDSSVAFQFEFALSPVIYLIFLIVYYTSKYYYLL